MSGYKEAISNFELRIGILEDRLATLPVCGNASERTLLYDRIEKVQEMLKGERYRFYEVQRLMGPQ